MLPIYGFQNKTIEIGVPFSNCRALTGSNFGNKLWNDKSINWVIKPTGSTTKTYPFTGCSLKASVPVSWGGTALDDIIEKSLEEKYNDLLARVEALENK